MHFIRHAQGFHNLAGHADPEAYRSFGYEDAHLTAYGWRQVCTLEYLMCKSSPLPKLQSSLCFHVLFTLFYIPAQAEAVQQHLAGLQQPLQVEVVICSPLTRTLETAVGIFGTREWTDDTQGKPLMLQQPSRPVRLSPQARVHTSLLMLLLLAAFVFKAWTGF